MSKLKRKVTVDAVPGKSDDRKKPSVFERLGPNAVSVRRSVGNYDESESDHEDFVNKCRNWVSTGACPYGNKCKFLHEPFPGVSKSSKGRDEESQDLRLRVKRKKDKNLDKSDSEESQERDRLQSKKEKLGSVKSAIVLKKPGAGSDSDTPEQWSGEDLDFKKELELEKRRQQLQRELSRLEDEEDVGGRENFKIEKKLQKDSSSNSDSTENRSRSRSRKMGKKKKSKRSKHSKSPSKSKLARSSSASNDSDETHRKHKKKSKKTKSHEMHSDVDQSPEPEQKTRKLLSPLKFKKLNKAVISKTITAFHSSEEEEAPPPPKMNLPLPSRSPIHPGLPLRLPDIGVLRAHSSDDEKSHRIEKSTKDKRSVTPKKKKGERKLSPEFVKELKVEKIKGSKRVMKSRSRSASGDRRSSFSPDGKKSKKLEKKKRQKKEEHELVKDASFERLRVRQENDGKEKDGTPMSDYRDFSPGQGVVKKKKDKKKDKKKKERDMSVAAEEVERKHKKSKAKDRERSESPDSRKKEKRSLERVSHREIDTRTLSPSVKGARDPYQDRRGIKALESTSRGDRERDVRDTRDARDDSRDVRPETRERESRALRDVRPDARDIRDAREIRDTRERDSREPRVDARDAREARDVRDPRDTRNDVREPRDTRSDVREPRDNRSDARDSRDPRSDVRDSRNDVRDVREPRVDGRDPRERDIRDREPRERIDMREGRDARERDLREPRDELRELRDPRDTREREIRDRLVPGREFEPTREIPLLDRDPSLDRRERYLPDDRFRDETRRDRYDDPRLATLALPGFDDRIRYPRGERDGFVDLVDRPPPFVRPERDMVDRRDLGDRRVPLELPFEAFVPNRVDLRYGDGPMRGGLRPPFDFREQGPGWDRGQGRSRGGWGRGGPPDRGGRYDDRNRRGEWDNNGRPEEFFGPDRRDWPDRRQTDHPDDRKDAVRSEGRDKRKEDKQDADREKDVREKEIGWNKESTQDKDRDKDREKESVRGEKESVREKDGKDKDSIRDDKTDKKSTRNAETKDDRKDERDRDKKEEKLDKDDSKRRERDRDRDQQDQSDIERKDRKWDDDKPKERKDDDRKEKVKEKDKVETKSRNEDRDSDRKKDEDRKKNDDERERSRKRRASRDGSASPSGKKPKDGSPALSTHSKRSAREPAIDRQFLDVDIHSDKGSITGSERSRSRRRGKEDEKRSKKGKDSEDHDRKRSRSHDGSEACSGKRRKLDIYPEGEGQLAGFVIKDTVGSDREENALESLEQHFSDWTDNDSDDDILNRPGDLNKVIEPTQDKENKRDKRSPSPHGSVCSHHSQKMKPKEESTEDTKDVKKPDDSEEMAELESISSDEGSLLANVKTAAVDALQIDWSSLKKDERPQPITGSALQRFKPGYLFAKMGISRQYAGEELHREVLSVCQKHEEQAAESNAKVGQENENEGNVAQAGIKTEVMTAHEDKPFKFLSDVAMFHSSALQKVKQRKELVSNIGPFRRALCARRDLEMRRQLCKLDKVLDASQLYASHEVDTDLYRQSIQILKQVKDPSDKLPTAQKDSNSACQKTLPVEVTCS